MIPYIAVFFLSFVVSYFCDLIYKRNRKISIFVMICLVLGISYFAAIRSYSVGYDINVYGLRKFNYEVANSNFVKNIHLYQNAEYAYSLLNYIVAKFTTNYHVFLFIHQLTLLAMLLRISIREKKANNVKFCMIILVYMLIWFNLSLNILRQSLAALIIVQGLYSLRQEKYIRYFGIIAIATLFHTSSIIMMVAPLLLRAMKKNSRVKNILVLILISLLPIILTSVFGIISEKIPVLTRYERYVVSNDISMSYRYIVIKWLISAAILLLYEKTSDRQEDKNLLKTYIILDAAFYSISTLVLNIYRLSYFFLAHQLIVIPRIEAMSSLNNKKIVQFLIVVLLVAYWINRYILSNFDKTIPYVIGV